MQRPCWTLNNATDGIGRAFPQHQEMGAGYDYAAPNSVHQIPFESLADFEPNFNTVIIKGSAKLTDLLSSAPITFPAKLLISDRFHKLLGQFKLPEHRYYSVPMVHRQKPVLGYCLLHLPGAKLAINDNSTPEDVEAMIDANPELCDVGILHLYRPARYAYFFVSEPLREAIVKEKLTGIRFGRAKIFR